MVEGVIGFGASHCQNLCNFQYGKKSLTLTPREWPFWAGKEGFYEKTWFCRKENIKTITKLAHKKFFWEGEWKPHLKAKTIRFSFLSAWGDFVALVAKKECISTSHGRTKLLKIAWTWFCSFVYNSLFLHINNTLALQCILRGSFLRKKQS